MKKFYFIIFSLSTLLKIILNQSIEYLLKGTMICSEENSNLIKYAFDGNIKTQFMTKNKMDGLG